MKIAIDAFGSDNAPSPEVEGAILAIKKNFCDKIYLVGKQDILNERLKDYKYDKTRVEVVHAEDVITMHDSASTSVKKKKDSSLVKAIQLHKDGIVDAVVSAGNTGAAMAASLFTYGRIKNVSRPAIAVTIPTISNAYKIVLDMGANADCAPEYLVQFAKLGSLYYQFIFHKEQPRVALLNIGEEPTKGNDLSKKTYQLLKEKDDINFIGNEEGKDILKNNSDVIVCDGFVGNVLLKTLEGSASSIFQMIKAQIANSAMAKIGALFMIPVFKRLKKKLSHNQYGGALLVGLNGITVISHGRSDEFAIMHAVKFASQIAESGFVEHAIDYFERNEI